MRTMRGTNPRKEVIEGNWLGRLGSLRIVFRITWTEDGSLTALLDSPDQEVFDMRADKVSSEDDNVVLKLDVAQLTYQGRLTDDATMEGTWKQGDTSLPLVLKKVDEVPSPPRRPQTPRKPYPYHEEEVLYENSEAPGVQLAGTLTLPRSRGVFSAVLLIPGSGPSDRDETVFSHKPFLVLADYLTRRGISVLRADKRGVGRSSGNYRQATTDDFASDALAGVRYLESRKEIDQRRIGLIGHSDGGRAAVIAAARSSGVAFIVMMAGPGINGYDNLVLQDAMTAKEKGATDEEVALIRSWVRRFYLVALEEKDDSTARRKMQDLYAARSAAEKHALRLLQGWSLEIDNALSPYLRYELAFDPRPFVEKVKCPVLAINGERDVQVPPKENIRAIEEALRAGGNHNYTVKELRNLNHLFQTVKPGGETNYAKIEETMSPRVLRLVSGWIREQTSAGERQKTGKRRDG